jgi:hypothetical protein
VPCNHENVAASKQISRHPLCAANSKACTYILAYKHKETLYVTYCICITRVSINTVLISVYLCTLF